MADETIITEFVVQVSGAIADVTNFRAKVDEAKEAIRAAMLQTGASIQEVTRVFAEQRKEIVNQAKGTAEYQKVLQQNTQVSKTFAQAQREMVKELKGVDTELKQKPKDTAQATSAFQRMGDVGKFVFGTVLGITAIGAFNALRTAIINLVKDGEEFLKTLFRFEISVRNLQRRGLAITMQEAADQVRNLRKEFGIFTTQEAMAAVANVQLLTANFGFTTKEMEKMTEASAALSIITGEDVDEAARKLALFLSSGYSEGLQRAGLAINKLTVGTKAYEMGLISTKTAYSQLTEVQRAHVAELVIEEQMVTLLEEARKVQESDYGKLVKATKDLEEEQNKLALAVVPLKKLWVDFQTTLLKAFLAVQNGFATLGGAFWSFLLTPFVAGTEQMIYVWHQFVTGQAVDGQELVRIWEDTAKQLTEVGKNFNPLTRFDPFKGMEDYTGPTTPIISGETADETEENAKKIQDVLKDLADAVRDYNEKYLDIQQDYLDKVGNITDTELQQQMNIWNNFFSDHANADYESTDNLLSNLEHAFGEYGEITEEGLFKALEIWQDYYDKIEDINRKLAQDITDENTDYQQDLEDLARDTQQRLEDAARKYHYDELRAEREFQEKMRRLREEFLFDLEDALRERDALQVLRLIRRYRLDVEQAQRQFELDRQARLEAYQQEIEDIRIQAQRKAEELRIEHERRLAELQLQAEREREQAEEDRQRALDELMRDMENEREQAAEERQRALDELKADFEKKLQEMLVQYGLQEGVTEEYVQTMANLFAQYLGQGGLIDQSGQQFIANLQGITTAALAELARLQEIYAQIDQLSAESGTSDNAPTPGGPYEQSEHMSRGGYATFGKYVMGEKGREFVTNAETTKALEQKVGPLTQRKLMDLITQRLNASGGNSDTIVTGMGWLGMEGRQRTSHAEVKIGLEDGLVGEIVDNSMDELSKIYLETRRERR